MELSWIFILAGDSFLHSRQAKDNSRNTVLTLTMQRLYKSNKWSSQASHRHLLP